MSSIDDVIARAQKAGEFGKKRNFTLASGRAVEKMRQFALPNPHEYLLELIQAAVANGASYVDISQEDGVTRLSFIGTGQGFPLHRVENLFDRLFVDQKNTRDADVHALAMAFNTLLGLDARVIMESGDGTEEGSSHLELHDGDLYYDRPDAPLDGTFIVVKGPQLDHKKEWELIIDRCLVSDIPICIDGRFLSTGKGRRFPIPFGYGRCTSFDEGDLFGTLGVNRLKDRDPVVKLVIHGVHVASVAFPQGSGFESVGGIICFSRLRRTVDHADVVRDEVWRELWARLQPYSEFALGQRTSVQPRGVQVLGDPDRTLLRDIKERLRGEPCLVLTPEDAGQREQSRAQLVGDMLGGVAVAVDKDLVETVCSFMPPSTPIIAPVLKDAASLAFFNQPLFVEAEGSTALPLRNLDDLPARTPRRSFAQHLPGTTIQGKVHTIDAARPPLEGVFVRLISFGRLVWQGSVPSRHPGLTVDITLPSLTLSQLEERFGALALIEHLLTTWEADLASFNETRLEGIFEHGCSPRTPDAHLVLAAIEDAFIKSLQVDDQGRATFELRPVAPKGTKSRELSLFRDLTAKDLSILDLQHLLERGGGLLYGVRDGIAADLSGLDRFSILKLDGPSEDSLRRLVGEAGYVRIDERDVLASHGPLVLRDIAVGLRTYPDALLAERADGTVPSAEEVAEAAEPLLLQLLDRVECLMTPLVPSSDHPLAQLDWQRLEWVRQACRHLQWAGAHRRDLALEDTTRGRLARLPLFVAPGGILLSIQLVEELFPQDSPLGFYDGRATDAPAALLSGGVPVSSQEAMTQGISIPAGLLLTPYVVHLLHRFWRVENPLDQARLTHWRKGRDAADAIVSKAVHNSRFRGRLALLPGGGPGVVSLTQDGKATRLVPAEHRSLCMMGTLHALRDYDEEELQVFLVSWRERLLADLRQVVRTESNNEGRQLRWRQASAELLRLILDDVRFTVTQGIARVGYGSPETVELAKTGLLRSKSGALVEPHAVLDDLATYGQNLQPLSSTPCQEHQAWLNAVEAQFHAAVGKLDASFAPRRLVTQKDPLPASPASPDVPALTDVPALLTVPRLHASAPPLRFDLPGSQHVVSPSPSLSSAFAEATQSETPPIVAVIPETVWRPTIGDAPSSAPTIGDSPSDIATPEDAAASGSSPATGTAAEAPDANSGAVDAPPGASSAPDTSDIANQVKKRAQLARAAGLERRRQSQKQDPTDSTTAIPEILHAGGRVDLDSLAGALEIWIGRFSPTSHLHGRLFVHFAVPTPHFWVFERLTHVPPAPGDLALFGRSELSQAHQDLRLGPGGYASTEDTPWAARASLDSADGLTRPIRVALNTTAPLVARAVAHQESCERLLPRLLLGCYGALNYCLDMITKDHEQSFQRKLFASLAAETPLALWREVPDSQVSNVYSVPARHDR